MIDRIDSFTQGMTLPEYEVDERTHLAVERCFQIIGEALNRLRRDAPHLHARIIESPRITGFRNFLAHVYDQINHTTVWRIIHHDLSPLREQATDLLRELDPEAMDWSESGA